MSGFVYLASPYSHQDPAVREARYRSACRAAARLMDDGFVVFSPIAHSHPIEQIGLGSVRSGQFWKNQDIPLLRHASRLVVLRLDGWEKSAGIAWEMETARAIHIPISYIDPEPA